VPDIDRLVDSLKNKWKLDKVAPGHCTANPRFSVCKKPSAMIIFTPAPALASNT